MSSERPHSENQKPENRRIDPTGCAIVIMVGSFGIGMTAIMIGFATGLATGKLPRDSKENNPQPTPTEVPINSFENSFTSDVQLTPTIQINP